MSEKEPREPKGEFRRTMEDEVKRRHAAAEALRQQEIRAQAVDLSVQWCTKFATATVLDDVFDVAEAFAAYITAGTTRL